MTCDHPQCTGIHGNGGLTGKRTWRNYCPTTKQKSVERVSRHRNENRLNYFKNLLQSRSYKARQRIAKRMEQYG